MGAVKKLFSPPPAPVIAKPTETPIIPRRDNKDRNREREKQARLSAQSGRRSTRLTDRRGGTSTDYSGTVLGD